MAKVSVIGAGSWGTALALLLSKNGHDGIQTAKIIKLRVISRSSSYCPANRFSESSSQLFGYLSYICPLSLQVFFCHRSICRSFLPCHSIYCHSVYCRSFFCSSLHPSRTMYVFLYGCIYSSGAELRGCHSSHSTHLLFPF